MELGEEPAAFEKLRESLRRPFGPRDGFEQRLVEDMAEIRWRRQRLMLLLMICWPLIWVWRRFVLRAQILPT